MLAEVVVLLMLWAIFIFALNPDGIGTKNPDPPATRQFNGEQE